MRRGEILSLKWDDIDFEHRIIHLLNTKSRKKREVPMNQGVFRALNAVTRHSKSEYVFCKKDGSVIGDIKKSFSTALKKSGIKDFRFHDLRHTAASQLVMAGIDLNTVRELLGHSSLAMTMRYAHLSPDHKKQAVDALSSRIDTVSTLAVPEEIHQEEAVLASV